MPAGTKMDLTPEELASELLRTSPHASVLEIQQWIQNKVGDSDPDFVRGVIVTYWTLQEELRTSGQGPQNGSPE